TRRARGYAQLGAVDAGERGAARQEQDVQRGERCDRDGAGAGAAVRIEENTEKSVAPMTRRRGEYERSGERNENEATAHVRTLRRQWTGRPGAAWVGDRRGRFSIRGWRRAYSSTARAGGPRGSVRRP